MYKSKLQELCQKKLWGLPKYSSMKDGPDHHPRFKASVSVNGVSFDSPAISTSSKHANNEAAKLAFLHFTSGSSMVSAEPIAGGPNIEETYQSPEIHSNALGFKYELQHQHKSQLQNYAQRNNLDLPSYSCKIEGPAHALHFKAMVTVDGHTFESPEFFNTLKEAEHAAAKAALMSLSLDGFQVDDTGIYKNFLQELAQNEGFMLPVYKTIRTGAPHMSTFFSTVEVEGEIFYGKAGKSKKQAEISAAKVAYAVFKERKSNGGPAGMHFKSLYPKRMPFLEAPAGSLPTGRSSRSGDFTLPSSPEDEALESTPRSDSVIPVNPQQNLKPGRPLVSSPAAIKYEQHAKESKDEVQEVDSAKKLSANDKVSSQDSIPSPVIPDMDKMTGKKVDSAEKLSANDKVSSQDSIPSPVIPDMDKMTGNKVDSAEKLSANDKVCSQDSIPSPVIPDMNKMTGKKVDSAEKLSANDKVRSQDFIPSPVIPDMNKMTGKKVDSAEKLSANDKVRSQDFIPSPVIPDMDKMTGNKNSYSSLESLLSSPKEGPSSSATMTPLDLSALSIADSKMEKTTRMSSYLLGNRVRVYPCIPDITFPAGITLLPISDNQWVAVSLEFPNEKGK